MSSTTGMALCHEKPEAVPLYHAIRRGFRGLADSEHLIAQHREQALAGKK